MNATDCARATEPHSRTVRHKTRLKVTARRLTCRSCGTSANIATILSRAYHQYEFGGRGALRIVTCGSPATDRNSHRMLCPSTCPRIRQPRQHRFRTDIVKAAAWRCQAVTADSAGPARLIASDEIRGRSTVDWLSGPSLPSLRVASPPPSAPAKESARYAVEERPAAPGRVHGRRGSAAKARTER